MARYKYKISAYNWYTFECDYKYESDVKVITELTIYNDVGKKLYPNLSPKQTAKKIYDEQYKFWFELIDIINDPNPEMVEY